MLLTSRGLNTYWPYGYQLFDFLLPFLPPRRTPPWLRNGGRTAGRLLLPRFPLPRLPLPGLPPERPPGSPPERPPGRRRNPPGRPFRNLGSGDLFSKSKTSLSSLSLSSFSSSMSASGSFLSKLSSSTFQFKSLQMKMKKNTISFVNWHIKPQSDYWQLIISCSCCIPFSH